MLKSQNTPKKQSDELKRKYKMQFEPKPLFTLTIGEFMALTKRLVEEVINEKAISKDQINPEAKKDEDVFSIRELMGFLRCSKASIHNYKKLGMPFYKIGRKLLFRKNEVLNFMKTLKDRIRKH